MTSTIDSLTTNDLFMSVALILKKVNKELIPASVELLETLKDNISKEFATLIDEYIQNSDIPSLIEDLSDLQNQIEALQR